MEGEVRNNKGMYNQSTSKERKGRGKDGLKQENQNKGLNKKKYINRQDQNATCKCQGQKTNWEIEMKPQRKKNWQVRTSKKTIF